MDFSFPYASKLSGAIWVDMGRRIKAWKGYRIFTAPLQLISPSSSSYSGLILPHLVPFSPSTHCAHLLSPSPPHWHKGNKGSCFLGTATCHIRLWRESSPLYWSLTWLPWVSGKPSESSRVPLNSTSGFLMKTSTNWCSGGFCRVLVCLGTQCGVFPDIWKGSRWLAEVTVAAHWCCPTDVVPQSFSPLLPQDCHLLGEPDPAGCQSTLLTAAAQQLVDHFAISLKHLILPEHYIQQHKGNLGLDCLVHSYLESPQ